MFNKSKTNNVNPPADEPVTNPVEDEEMASEAPENTAPTPPAPAARSSMMDMITTTANKPSILSEGFSFRGEIAAKGAIHVEGALNGQIQVTNSPLAHAAKSKVLSLAAVCTSKASSLERLPVTS